MRVRFAKNQFIQAIDTPKLEIRFGETVPLGEFAGVDEPIMALDVKVDDMIRPFCQGGDMIRLQQIGRRKVYGMTGNQGRGMKYPQNEFRKQPAGVVKTPCDPA